MFHDQKYFRTIVKFFCLDKYIFSQTYQREIITHVRTTVELHATRTMYSSSTTKFRRILPQATENSRMRRAPLARANACN